MELPEISDYTRLFLEDTPLLDVRAPVEFEAGAFPTAHNLPLLTDEERHLIGIRYKEAGQEAAVELGRELVDGLPRKERTERWAQFVEKHPQGVLYCFRGGMRSRITQEWIYAATGIAYPRIKGGYKALRNFLLEQIELSVSQLQPLVIGGRTGAGKTILIKKVKSSIDLEGLAWHRGSAFGRHVTPQPTQIDFENRLSIAMLKHRVMKSSTVVLEDESKAIGSRHLPPALYERMSESPLAILEVSLEERIKNSIDEYVTAALEEYQAHYGEEQGMEEWESYARESLKRIARRLGGERYQRMEKSLDSAMREMHGSSGHQAHADWIAQLLVDYYDPMYDYQLKKKEERIVFSGDMNAVIQYIEEITGHE
ncbi:MAG: tRNA 2-selenouridine(34) synthase MnmH [Gammaproteobacteria bacterium]|nr:MAG: tRNA 2-selenouridine(34) synthase MnmH [Gammaproteobacteria bacterium]